MVLVGCAEAGEGGGPGEGKGGIATGAVDVALRVVDVAAAGEARRGT